MVNKKGNPKGQKTEIYDGPLPPIDSEKKPGGEIEMFECPSCQVEVVADAAICPGCGVAFEREEVPISEIEEEPLPPPPLVTEQEQMAPPQDVMERQVNPPEEAQPTTQLTPPPSYSQNKTEQQIAYALNEYSKKRRGRYLSGALFLGLGIILFVFLWVFVVNQVLVTETENLFGFEIILLLVGAGIFFILGLYMILTYPKSSLVDVFTSMTQTQQTN